MNAAREGRAARLGGLSLLVALLSGAHPLGAQQDAFSLEGLVVTAAPTAIEEDAVTRHVTVLDAADLARFGAGSLSEALRDVAGIHVVRGGSFGGLTSLFLRGGESDYTLVMVDGVQVNQAGGGFDFAELTTEAVERVEIVRGPGSALYGSDAVSGVIHVITKTGRGTPVTTASIRGGSFGRLDLSAGLRAGGERAGYGISLSRQRTDGLYPFNSQSSRSVLSGTVQLRPDDRSLVRINLRLSDRDYHFPTDASGAIVDRNAFTFSDATTARVSTSRAVTSRLTLEAAVGINETDGGTDDAVDGPADTLGFYAFSSLDHFRRTVGEVRAHLRLDPAVLTAGIEMEEQRQRSFNESMSQFGPSNGRSESARRNVAGFVHASGSLAGFAYQAGARVEDNERFGGSATWQAGVSRALPGSGATLLRASIGTGLKEPTFFENFATGFVVGNPDLGPEHSTSWEVGLEHGFTSGITAGATYFDQRFRDLIQYTSAPAAPGDPNYFNVAAASARGLEIDVDALHGPWGAGISAGWTDTEVTDAGFDSGDGATFVEGGPLLRRPRWQGAAYTTVSIGPVTFASRLRYLGARSDRDFSTFPATPVALGAFRLWSAGVVWQLRDPARGGPGVALELNGENLTDTEYSEIVGFPGPGRGVYFGGSVQLAR